MRKIVFLSVILVSVMILSACGAAVKPTVNISMGTKGFSPERVTVKVGTAVMWISNDYDSPHKIKSILFNSSEITFGQRFTQVFEASGIYDYSCGLHPGETGKIIVE